MLQSSSALQTEAAAPQLLQPQEVCQQKPCTGAHSQTFTTLMLMTKVSEKSNDDDHARVVDDDDDDNVCNTLSSPGARRVGPNICNTAKLMTV